MALSKNLLSRDEVVVRHMRTHVKAILANIAASLVLVIAGATASAMLPERYAPWSHVVAWSLVAVLLIPLLLIPLVRWATTTYTLTSKRIITRHGVFTKRGHDLPLSRISDVTHERGLSDRFFGCGTLTLQTSADDPLVLVDIPRVETVQVEITDLLFHDVQGAVDADPTD
ncbi:PH domain-containing protein [Actinomyces sp. B33]|uniref:PH domain-containing protein n=1 Tax=Actinomyces sp. B33 TaxID=2942131 RepID=UPI002340B77A|nr:PH domain-containing protein [Actinomyces sp. B33]MDC4232239.1 PH domain-containing protein [Actinomyces sp. B33]